MSVQYISTILREFWFYPLFILLQKLELRSTFPLLSFLYKSFQLRKLGLLDTLLANCCNNCNITLVTVVNVNFISVHRVFISCFMYMCFNFTFCDISSTQAVFLC